ncbi:hypothetical protein JHD47_07180 [Sulfurimonas sp. SAG-AH-194-L11]|nr:hypothetical protein [Sulfurimonas sp. SAG-AH-194-L11]MDF1877599.1 hypothetical protein [Sulfurimonas sp. SAG-AH-194-L11]
MIKIKLTEELALTNAYIDEVESYSAITAPESFLGIILSEQKPSDLELKHFYVKKRKLMYFLGKLPSVDSFLCTNCKKIIELDRLLVMPKASFCENCVSI